MSVEVLVNVTSKQTRVAVVADSKLQDLYVESNFEPILIGNIYLGKVARIVPGFAAFIEIGLERLAFLPAEELTNNITTGQHILVQVIRGPIEEKGAAITLRVAISSRTLIMLPDAKTIHVSQRITDQQERDRLKNLLSANLPNMNAGFIIRTSAIGIKSFDHDLSVLQYLWQEIQAKTNKKIASLIYQELPLGLRVLRDIAPVNTTTIKTDNRELAQQMLATAGDLPNLYAKIEYYDAVPIFSLFGIKPQIKAALQRKVQLKNGSYLLIDQTTTLTVIDVNSGTFEGDGDIESSRYMINREAAKELARQMRIRNLSGIIIVDFINMKNSRNIDDVIATLKAALISDTVKAAITSVSPLGVVQITRQYVRPSLQEQLCELCPTCKGRGLIENYA